MTKRYGRIRPRAFLTGASGYIGLHILQELLTAGHQVTVVVRSPRKLGPLGLNPRLRVVEADLEDQACMDDLLVGHEVCIHAALIWGAPGSELEVRDVATAAKLFDSSARVGLNRCIYMSSVAVHRPFSGAMSERDGLSVTDLYGATKAAGVVGGLSGSDVSFAQLRDLGVRRVSVARFLYYRLRAAAQEMLQYVFLCQ